MIEAHNLSTVPDVRHGFFTRKGGRSVGLYGTLNCGYGSDDDRELVRQNRIHVATSLGLFPEQLITVHQIHSPEVVTVSQCWSPDEAPKADAMVTCTPGTGLGVLTADCAPVLFADRQNGVVGAAHAGWRGALGGVCEATIAAMETIGAERDHVFAAIGPSISVRNYEVGTEFHNEFITQNDSYDRFFRPADQENHYMFDLPGFIEHRLNSADIGSVERHDLCTYEREADFFSYRRATHRGELDYGRQISAITLGPDAFLTTD